MGGRDVACYRWNVPDDTDPDGFLSADDVARLAGVSVDTIEKWRADGYGPRWYRLPGVSRSREQRRAVPRYKRRDVIAWLEQCAIETRGAMPPRRRSKGKR